MARPFVSRLKAKLAGQSEEDRKMQIAVLGIDLGKNSCSLAGLDHAGRVVVRRRAGAAAVIHLGSL